MAQILSGGRIAETVTVSCALCGQSVATDLIVDTGAEVSLFPYHKIRSALHTSSCRVSCIVRVPIAVGGGLLKTVTIRNVDVGCDSEAHGGGALQAAKCAGDIRAHMRYLAQTHPFSPTEGVLGMDHLDALAVDPAKSSTGTNAFLVRRV